MDLQNKWDCSSHGVLIFTEIIVSISSVIAEKE